MPTYTLCTMRMFYSCGTQSWSQITLVVILSLDTQVRASTAVLRDVRCLNMSRLSTTRAPRPQVPVRRRGRPAIQDLPSDPRQQATRETSLRRECKDAHQQAQLRDRRARAEGHSRDQGVRAAHHRAGQQARQGVARGTECDLLGQAEPARREGPRGADAVDEARPRAQVLRVRPGARRSRRDTLHEARARVAAEEHPEVSLRGAEPVSHRRHPLLVRPQLPRHVDPTPRIDRRRRHPVPYRCVEPDSRSDPAASAAADDTTAAATAAHAADAVSIAVVRRFGTGAAGCGTTDRRQPERIQSRATERAADAHEADASTPAEATTPTTAAATTPTAAAATTPTAAAPPTIPVS